MRGLAMISVLASGCAFEDGVDLSGDYVVQAAFVSSSGCTTLAPTMSSTMVLKFTDRLSRGVTYTRCMDAAGTMCGVDYSDTFDERIDGGWRGHVVLSGPTSDTTCVLERIEQAATIDDGRLIVDTRFFHDEVELPNSLCTDQEAESRGSSLSCTMRERLEATKQ